MVLEQQLREFFPDNAVEVIIGAVPGYSSREVLDWYDTFLHRLKPDIAIIFVGWNDIGQFHPFGLRYKNENLYRKRTLMGWLMEHFYVARIPYFIQGRLERLRPIDRSALTHEEQELMDEFIPVHYEANLKSLITKLREGGSAVYLIAPTGLITNPPMDHEIKRIHFPRNMGKKLELYRAVYDKYVQSLEKIAQDTQTPVIDLKGLIRTPADREIFRDTMHTNENGSQVIGEFLARRLRPDVGGLITTNSN